MDESMDIYSPPGTEVVFLNKNGYALEREYASKVFVPGKVYIVESIDVGNWSSTVKFVGVEGEFNTVMFAEVGK
jgi:hypothetical protein